jgi:hypothetical protein
MKLIKGLIKKNLPKRDKSSQPKKEKILTVGATIPIQRVYHHFIEAIHNDINCIITVIDRENEEVERRYARKQQMNGIITELSKQYKKPKVAKPVRVVIDINLPKSNYISEPKKEVRTYSPKTYTDHEKFTKAFQQLVDCLDEHRLRFELEYKKNNDATYCIDMSPKSRGIAPGIHRVTINIETGIFTYFYGMEITKLKKIHSTNDVSKLFE